MTLRKILSLALALALLLTVAGCGGNQPDASSSEAPTTTTTASSTTTTTESTDTTTSTESGTTTEATEVPTSASASTTTTTTKQPTTTTKAPCKHEYTDKVTKEMKPLADGVRTFTCKKCKASYTEAIPASKTLKILAIGNSFSSTAVCYLWDMCTTAGMTDVVVASQGIGSSVIDDHWNRTFNGKTDYNYVKYTSSQGVSTNNVGLLHGIKDEDWDVIVIQQGSRFAGIPSHYSNLERLVEWLHANKTNPDCKVFFQMTWAYQGDCIDTEFYRYDYDQKTMFEATLSTVQEKVLPVKAIAGVIPSATAVQNVRTSYIGDTLTFDGRHLTDMAMYIPNLTWFGYFTGAAVDSIDWIPANCPNMAKDLPMIREAVNNALKNPYKLTPSSYTKAP